MDILFAILLVILSAVVGGIIGTTKFFDKIMKDIGDWLEEIGLFKKTGKKMKPHYFGQNKPDEDDLLLKMTIDQGYVPTTCLLGGNVVMGLMNDGKDPCKGCNGPREKCGGRRKS
jgi:hypothetical protein